MFWYNTYQQMHIVRLAENIAARKWSRKCGTLRCTSRHCVVPRCRLDFGLILLYYIDSIPPVVLSPNGGINNDVQWRSLNFRFGTLQQPDFGFPYIAKKL